MENDFLKRALLRAEERRGFCAPNPAVGAVVVKDGRILSEGSHFAAGHPHAEVEALKALGPEAQGATLYVTLEPCAHFGRTPPCTNLILEKRLGRVVYGFRDPNPPAANGAAALLQAGISCEHLSLPEVARFYESYAHWIKHERPFVTAKLAMSLDGKTAGKNGARVSLTGETANELTHTSRKRADAILTTFKTIAADDPSLNARTGDGPHAKPVYVADSRAELSPSSRLFGTASQVTVFHGDDAPPERLERLRAKGARTISIPRRDIGAMLSQIGKDGKHDLWIEAGGTFFRSLLEKKLVHRALIYVAPKWLGPEATPAFANSNAPHDFSADFADIRWAGCGADALCEMRRVGA